MAYEWLDTTAYPFKANYVEVDGHFMHYIEEGEGEVVLFVHGTPSWSFDFRHQIKGLRDRFRCIAVDHIGFGLSDKPEHYDYSTQNHSVTLEKFILANNLENITLVVHDFGGPIALHVAMKHPEKIKRLVVLNSWLWSSQNDPDYIKLTKVLRSPILPFLYRYLNFSPRFLLPQSFGDKKPSKDVLKHYTLPFENRKQRNGTLAFAHSLLHDQGWFEQLWDSRSSISDKPTLFIWGMKDPIIKPRNLDRFLSGFSNTTVVKLETCGHVPQEEEPEAVMDAIVDFLSSR